jgi:hypothetical protein
MEARSPGVKQHIEDGECKTAEDVDRVTRSVSLMKQELLTLPEHMSSPPFSVGFTLFDLYSSV